jgi:uncharacterized membrane protein YhaH (DUF805 family)
MSWYIQVLKKYAVFSGRACRMEFWMFSLFNFIIAFVLFFIEGLAGGPGVLGNLYGLAVLLPGLGVSVRRLHDTGLSGWWLFIGLIPLIGAIILLIFMVSGSQEGTNKYDPSPVLVEEHEAESEPELSEVELKEEKLNKIRERKKLSLDE